MEGGAMKRTVFVLVILITLLFACPAQTAGETLSIGDASDQIIVTLVDADRNPIEGIRVNLILYDFKDKHIDKHQTGSCTTDTAGRCGIEIDEAPPQDASNMIRGQLDVGKYGTRSLLWPGGTLEVPLWLKNSGDELDVPGEPPYDGAVPDDGLPVREKPRIGLVNVLWPVMILGGFSAVVVVIKKQEENQ
jgi:hypothetical protein